MGNAIIRVMASDPTSPGYSGVVQGVETVTREADGRTTPLERSGKVYARYSLTPRAEDGEEEEGRPQIEVERIR